MTHGGIPSCLSFFLNYYPDGACSRVCTLNWAYAGICSPIRLFHVNMYKVTKEEARPFLCSVRAHHVGGCGTRNWSQLSRGLGVMWILYSGCVGLSHKVALWPLREYCVHTYMCTQAQTHSHIYMYTNTHAHIPCIDMKITNKCKMEHKEGRISYFVLGGTKSKADLTDAVFWQWTQWLASSCSCWMSSPSLSNSQTTSDSSVRGDKLLAVLNYKALG